MRTPRPLIRLRRRGQRGAVLPLAALSLTFIVGSVAFGIEHGRITTNRQNLQKIADVIALDATRVLDGSDAATSEPGVRAAALDSATRNAFLPRAAAPTATGFSSDERDISLTLGFWDIERQTFTPSGPNDIPNAVRVTATDGFDFYFRAGGSRSSEVATALLMLPGDVDEICLPGDARCTPGTTTSVGTPPTTPPVGCPDCLPAFGKAETFTLGSFIAGFTADTPDTAGAAVFAEVKTAFLNATLGAAFGATLPEGDLDLTAVGYQGLAASSLTLDDLRIAMGLGTLDELLTSRIQLGDLLVGAADVLERGGQSSNVQFLERIRATTDGSTDFRLGDTIHVVEGAGGSAATAELNLLHVLASVGFITGEDLLSAAVALPVRNPVTGASFIDARLEVAVLSPPVTVVGPPGIDPWTGRYHSLAETGQVRAELTMQVRDALLPTPGAAAITIPITIDGGDATSGLATVECTAPTDTSASAYDIATSAYDIRIAHTTDLTAATPIYTPGSLSGAITGSARFSNVGVADPAYPVVGPYDSSNRYRVAGGTNVDVGAALLSDLRLVGLVPASLTSQLSLVFADLDASVIRPLTSALGVSLAGADLTASDLDCGIPILV